MTADVCECGHLRQSHQDVDLERVPCHNCSCRCPVFVSEDEPLQLLLVAAEPPVKEAA